MLSKDDTNKVDQIQEIDNCLESNYGERLSGSNVSKSTSLSLNVHALDFKDLKLRGLIPKFINPWKSYD